MEYIEPLVKSISELFTSVVSKNSFGESVIRVLGEKESRKVKMEYDGNGNLIYVGINDNPDANDSDNDWTIKKMFYDADGNLITVIVKQGSWTDRDTLFV